MVCVTKETTMDKAIFEDAVCYGSFDASKNWKPCIGLKQQVEIWLNEFCSGWSYTYSIKENKKLTETGVVVSFHFDNEEDLIAFKLRWL